MSKLAIDGGAKAIDGFEGKGQPKIGMEEFLEMAGVSPERFRLEWCSSAEAQRFVDIVNEMTGKVKELGPLGTNEPAGEELQEKLTAARDAICSERLRWLLGKEYNIETGPNVFEENYPEEAFKEILGTAVKDEYYKALLLNATRREPLSVKEMGAKYGLDSAEVLRLITNLRGRNIVDVKEVKGTSPIYTALV